jgi:hypothetical protein
MPHQVRGALLHARSGTELPCVRTELRLLHPSLSTRSARVELGRHCYAIKCSEGRSSDKSAFPIIRDGVVGLGVVNEL